MSEARSRTWLPFLLGWGVRVLLIPPMLLTAAWLACWLQVLATAWWLVAALFVVRPGLKRTVIWALVGVVLVPWCVLRYDQRAAELNRRVQAKGPTALQVHDGIAVYGLHLHMVAAGALLGFPEVALESFGLVLPLGDRTVSTERFPWCAPKIADVLSKPGNRKTRVAWVYHQPDESFRVALAMNPTHVTTRMEGPLQIASASVPVDYPPRSTITFVDLGPVRVQIHEGLFHALEETGWLFPYTLTFETRRDPSQPLPELCEAWSVRAGRMLTGAN